MDLTKEMVKTIPIWVKIAVAFKYWGLRALEKIIKPVGKLIRVDETIVKREKLNYARILIEVQTEQAFPDQIKFYIERGHHETICYATKEKEKRKSIEEESTRPKGGTSQLSASSGEHKDNGSERETRVGTNPMPTPQQEEAELPNYHKNHNKQGSTQGQKKKGSVAWNPMAFRIGLLDMTAQYIHGVDVMQSPEYNQRIQRAWNWKGSGTDMYCITRKLKKVKEELKELNRTGFVLSRQKLKEHTALIEAQQKIYERPGDKELAKAGKEAYQVYKLKLEIYSQFLKQKAKAHWLKEGDSNTRLFHKKAFQEYYLKFLGENKRN
ncbi:Protein bassoon [Bienertia sinuspersici]